MSESFDLGEPPQPALSGAYRVLARKYRPQRFSELIGQDAMVTTLGNAIKRDRLAHAFLLTGVRGVGKTSTARLIAKALNCENGPTIDPCNACEACVAIAEGRHMDVVEMDAASNTGVDDVREIIEAVRYAAVSARYKVYIIDEVHMLSKNAFNALLKTLEEPPPHVKFLFATTEVNKVPVTVLSRCQRFDLRRISASALAQHFATVLKAEGVAAQDEALALIANAAEGSVRDGLSILDQAIAHAALDGEGAVSARQVREMLGLSDRGAIRKLFATLLAGDSAGALSALQEQRDLGVEPVAVLRGLLELTHRTTLAKVGAPVDATQSAEEREALEGWASSLSFSILHRIWQLLLKGHDEVSRAAHPGEAADMALLRIIHASQLPDPGELARKLEAGQMVTGQALSVPSASGGPTSSLHPIPSDFPALISLLEANGKPHMGQQLHDFTGLLRYAPPQLDLAQVKPLPEDFARDLATALKSLTGMAWQVQLTEERAAPSLLDQDRQRENEARDAILADPAVMAAMRVFPDAELIDFYRQDQRSVIA
ncbi:MAG: DNA polymerase III subunit gamma/tau [Sphingomonadaceae bacterium]|mgnify:CR=1 FL=1